MIYLFHGTDIEKARAKAFAWIAATREKVPDAFYVRLSAEQITPESLEEIRGTQGLFFSKTLALLDDPFALAASGEAVMEALKELADSPNPIALLAPKLLAARAKKLEANAEKVFLHDLATKKPARGFNGALVNALGARDGAVLWKEIVKAMREGDAPEMIHGLLHWKARDLMQKGSRVWSSAESRSLSRDLILLLSDARSGSGLTLGDELERFALSL